jgi:hypothetical protein
MMEGGKRKKGKKKNTKIVGAQDRDEWMDGWMDG